MFTLIIPLYNKVKHIERAVNSALSQSVKFDEIIVVDDGSTDRGAEIIHNRYENLVRLIKKKNGGVSSARNLGVRSANTKYICFLDADDALEPEYLKELQTVVFRYSNVRIFSVSHYVCTDFGCKARCDNNKVYYLSKPVLKYSFNYGVVNSSSVCAERNLFLDFPFPEGVKDGEDVFVWLRVFSSNSLVFLAKPLVKIYKNSTNRSVLRDAGQPYHLEYYLGNPNYLNFQLKVFLFFNVLRQCYGYAAMGRTQYVKNVLKLVKRNNLAWYFFAAPSLIISPKIFSGLKKALGKS